MTLDPAGTRLGKRAAERIKRRKRRRRLTGALVVAVAVLLALVSLVLIRNGGQGGGRNAAPTRSQQTLLLQVKGADGSAVASALLAHDQKSHSGVVILVPPQVLPLRSCGGVVAFGKLLQNASATTSRNTLSDLMGVTVDGSWVLDSATFGQLVDQVGGVKVTVDQPVLSGPTVLVQTGAQTLNGASALQFATYLGPQEAEQARLARLQAVLDALIDALPSNAEPLLRALGGGSQLSETAAQSAALLGGLKRDDAAGNLQNRSLPVTLLASGNDDIHFGIDVAGTRSLVDGVLADSIPPGARQTGNAVLLENGAGPSGLNEQARDKLVPAGFVCVGSSNAPSFTFTQTLVLVKQPTAADATLGARVAKALGVPDSSVHSSDQVPTYADVIVIVGKDFTGK